MESFHHCQLVPIFLQIKCYKPRERIKCFMSTDWNLFILKKVNQYTKGTQAMVKIIYEHWACVSPKKTNTRFCAPCSYRKACAWQKEKIWTWMVRFSEVMLPTVALGHRYEIKILYNIHKPLSRNVTWAKRHPGFILTPPINAMCSWPTFYMFFCSFYFRIPAERKIVSFKDSYSLNTGMNHYSYQYEEC